MKTLSERTRKVSRRNGPRPAGPPDKCFYCHEALGADHKPDCPVWRKVVTVRMIVEYEIDVPNHWGEQEINFNRHESTWCADNAIDELRAVARRNGCLCSLARFEVVAVERVH